MMPSMKDSTWEPLIEFTKELIIVNYYISLLCCDYESYRYLLILPIFFNMKGWPNLNPTAA